ncbi:MAG: globin [Pseudomonadota bacterium]
MTAIEDSLAVCAQRAGDIVPAVYRRFFALEPDALDLMGHSDQGMRGRMFESALNLLLDETPFEDGCYFDWELGNHFQSYRVLPAMYATFFEATRDCVRDALAGDWSARHEAAWNARVHMILERVRMRAPT